MIVGCTGGHQHPDFTGAVAYDFTDLTWKLHEHNNGGVRYGGTGPQALGYTESQTTGSPYYEISDATTGQVPVPGHPYHHNQILLYVYQIILIHIENYLSYVETIYLLVLY